MEYLLMKNILPSHILRDINDYNKIDVLTLEWWRFLHSQKYLSVLWQISYCKTFYNREMVYRSLDSIQTVMVKELIGFPEYILQEINYGSMNWL